MNKDVLILVTQEFPYSKREPFLELEMQYLEKEFDKIFIFSQCQDTTVERTTGNNVFVCTIPQIPPKENKGLVKLLLKESFGTICSDFFLDVLLNFRYYLKQPLKMLKLLSKKVFRGHYIRNYIRSTLKLEENENYYYYSYWLDTPAYAGGLLSLKINNLKVFSRAHRYDIYYSQNEFQYIPLRQAIAKRLNRIFVISKDGQEYLIRKSHIPQNKVHVHRLGVNKSLKPSLKSQDGVFRIYSCSFLADVKRIWLIIDALSLIDSIKVEWLHIGGGESLARYEQLAKQKLSSNHFVTYRIIGDVPNSEIKNFYTEQAVDLFINVSWSEGIPVTMMDAFSFKVPVIATNVGGVAEIVNDENGILLPPNPTPEEIRTEITRFANYDFATKQKYRECAFNTWNTLYNAERNYLNFIEQMKHSN